MESQENSDRSSATSGCSGVTDTTAVSRNVQGTPLVDEIELAMNNKVDRLENEAAKLAMEGEYRHANRLQDEASGVTAAWFIAKRIIEKHYSTKSG